MCFVFQPNSFFHKIITTIISHSFLFTYLFSKVLRTGCGISKRSQLKLRIQRGRISVLALRIESHSQHKCTSEATRPNKRYLWRDKFESGNKSHTWLQIRKVHSSAASYLFAVLERKKLLPEQDKGDLQGTGAERRQQGGGGWWGTGQRLDLSGSIGD